MGRSARWLMLGMALAATLGCGAEVRYIRRSAQTFSPRGEPAQVRVFYAEPVERYDLLGLIDWEDRPLGLSTHAVADVIPLLKRKAWEVGGDAIIVRRHVVDMAMSRPLRISADVIRFRS